MSLVSLIGQIESGNNPNASLTDYAGNVSVNAQYQQSAGYIAQYGSGAAGIENQANQILANNPNATLGDFYSAYNHGSVLPWDTYSSRFPTQANNFLSNAQAQGYSQDTPLASVLNGTATPTTGASGDDYSIFDGNAPNDTESGNPLGQSMTVNGDVSSSAGTADFNDLPDNTFDQPTTSIGSGGANMPGYVGSGTGGAVGGTGGQPIYITDLPGLDTSVTGAGTAVQKGATTAGTDVENSAGGLAGTMASIINSFETYTSSAFVILALVVMGIIFVASGLRMFGKREGLALPSV